MPILKSMRRARLMLMKWVIDSSIERDRPMPAWVQARLQRDDGLARYARAASEVDRRLKHSAAAVRTRMSGCAMPTGITTEANQRQQPKSARWPAKLAAAAALALVMSTTAVVVMTYRSGDVDDAPGRAHAKTGSPQRFGDASALDTFKSSRFTELLHRTRDAIEPDNWPLVLEARRLANDSREIGNRLLDQLPIRPGGLKRWRGSNDESNAEQRDHGTNEQHSGA